VWLGRRLRARGWGRDGGLRARLAGDGTAHGRSAREETTAHGWAGDGTARGRPAGEETTARGWAGEERQLMAGKGNGRLGLGKCGWALMGRFG
jgi:hypothetical protein